MTTYKYIVIVDTELPAKETNFFESIRTHLREFRPPDTDIYIVPYEVEVKNDIDNIVSEEMKLMRNQVELDLDNIKDDFLECLNDVEHDICHELKKELLKEEE